MHIWVFIGGFFFGTGFATIMIAFIMGANRPIPVNVRRQVSYEKCDTQQMDNVNPTGASGMHPIMTKPRDTFTPSVDKFKDPPTLRDTGFIDPPTLR